jgi:hypothetical protein
MPTDDDAPEEHDESEDDAGDEVEAADPNHFGIDLGRRGDRAEQQSRDEVDAPEPVRERPATRSLSDRLASAAADRDEAAANAPKPRPSTSEDE